MQRPGKVFSPRTGADVLAADEVVLLVDEEAVRHRDETCSTSAQQMADTPRRAPGEDCRNIDTRVERGGLARQGGEGRERLAQAKPVRAGFEGEHAVRLAGRLASGLPAGWAAQAVHVRGATDDQEVGDRHPVRGGVAYRHDVDVRAETRSDRLGDCPGVAV